MYTDVAYLGKKHEDIVDNTKPIVVTAAGHYIVNKNYKISTKRRLGRGDFQVLYIAGGKAQFYFGEKKQTLEKGALVIFRPHEPQMYFLYKEDFPETYWVHFTGYEAEKLLEKYNMPRQTVTYVDTAVDLGWYFKNMIYELREKKPDYENMLILQLGQLFISIVRSIESAGSPRYSSIDEIDKAMHYFEANYSREINIEQYAKDNFIKPCWFIRKFKSITGRTPLQYVIFLRIDKAKKMLADTACSISQISYSVGYDNPLYFSRIFSKYVGVSPKEYRAQCKKEERIVPE